MMSDIKVMFGEVMHRRLFPRVNGFRYPIFYLSVPIMPDMPARGDWRVGINRRALMSFYDIDHGDRTPGNLHRWIMSILTDHGVADITDIRLICLPRTMGYVFNPVSFWMCRDQSGDLRAVLCEVNNTFGETHAYLCVPSPGEKISAETRVQAQKLFHVSPFLPREGHYQFRFDDRPDKTGMWIDYYDGSGEKQVLTALTGSWEAYSPPLWRRMFFGYPWVTGMAMIRIHRQALILWFKKQKFFTKPLPLNPKITMSDQGQKIIK